LLSLVLPATDEEDRLADVARELIATAPYPLELVLVVNGSRNRTAEVARRVAAGSTGAKALVFPERLGKGGAVLAGFAAATGEVLGFVDADGPFDPADLWSLGAIVTDGRADCAIASKWRGLRYGEVTTYAVAAKKLFSRGLNAITRTVFRLPFADTQGGAKFLSRAAWEAISATAQPFLCTGFDFDVELLHRLVRAGAKVEERFLPCRRQSTTFRHLGMGRMLLRLARLRLFPPDPPRRAR
jgi:glycosyltransferase involved in cell wall biosynthesis